MMVAALGPADTLMVLLAAAGVLVVLLLVVSARRRPREIPHDTSPAATSDARHPMTDLPEKTDTSSPLPVALLASNARLSRDLGHAEERLEELRMAHSAQRRRVERAGDFLGRAGVPTLRSVSGDSAHDALATREREIKRLRAALLTAESHLLAATSAGAVTLAGPSRESVVPSAARGVPGGLTTLPPQKRMMSVSRNPHQPRSLPQTQSRRS